MTAMRRGMSFLIPEPRCQFIEDGRFLVVVKQCPGAENGSASKRSKLRRNAAMENFGYDEHSHARVWP